MVPGLLIPSRHKEIHSETLRQNQVAVILGFTFASLLAMGSAQELVRIPQLNPK